MTQPDVETRVVQRAPCFRLYPTPEQSAELLQWERSLKWLWNICLEQWQHALRRTAADRARATEITSRLLEAEASRKAAEKRGEPPPPMPPGADMVDCAIGCWGRCDALVQQRQLTVLQSECGWMPRVAELKRVPRLAKGAVITNLETAWTRFFDAMRDAGERRRRGLARPNDEPEVGPPAFKRQWDRAPIEIAGCFTRVEGDGWKATVHVPNLGPLSVRLHRPLFGCHERDCAGADCARCALQTERKITRIVISRDVDHWNVAIGISWREPVPASITEPVLGVNRGIDVLAATSDGRLFEGPRFAQKSADRLARRQREAAQLQEARKLWIERVRKAFDAQDGETIAACLKGEAPAGPRARWVAQMFAWDRQGRVGEPPRCGQGANEIKAREKVAKVHRKVRFQRDANLHAISSELARTAGTVVMENFQIQRMTRSARGTAEEPGEGVERTARFNAAVLDGGWGKLAQLTEYKIQYRGGSFEKRSAAFEAQKCRACGCVDPRNRADCRTLKCVQCGHTEQGDVLTARNMVDSRQQELAARPPKVKKVSKRTKRNYNEPRKGA